MITYAQQASHWKFTTAYFIGESLDSSNFIFTATMMMSRLKSESRGAVLSVNAVTGSFAAILLLRIQADIQGRHGDNFGVGAKEVFTSFWYTLFAYFCLLLVYVAFSKDSKKEEEKDKVDSTRDNDNSLELR